MTVPFSVVVLLLLVVVLLVVGAEEDPPVVKLKFQGSVVDFIDAAKKGQYAALTAQSPSMVAHTLPPGHWPASGY